MNRKTTIVTFDYTRGFPIDPFSFKLNENSLPETSPVIEEDY